MQSKSPVLIDETDNKKRYTETIIGEHQEQYNSLPAIITTNGVIISRWELDDDELAEVNETRSIYHIQSCFDRPMNPIRLQVFEPHETQIENPEMCAYCTKVIGTIILDTDMFGDRYKHAICVDCNDAATDVMQKVIKLEKIVERAMQKKSELVKEFLFLRS